MRILAAPLVSLTDFCVPSRQYWGKIEVSSVLRGTSKSGVPPPPPMAVGSYEKSCGVDFWPEEEAVVS